MSRRAGFLFREAPRRRKENAAGAVRGERPGSDGDKRRRGRVQAVCCAKRLLPGVRACHVFCFALHACCPECRRRFVRQTRADARGRCAAPESAMLTWLDTQDDYIKYFVNKPSNRPPLINRGHYSRVTCVRYAREFFSFYTLYIDPPGAVRESSVPRYAFGVQARYSPVQAGMLSCD